MNLGQQSDVSDILIALLNFLHSHFYKRLGLGMTKIQQTLTLYYGDGCPLVINCCVIATQNLLVCNIYHFNQILSVRHPESPKQCGSSLGSPRRWQSSCHAGLHSSQAPLRL